MELRLYLPKNGRDWSAGEVHVTVRTESDIRTAGFAAGRAVREWLRSMPFVPSSSDLEWAITAEVIAEKKPAPAPAASTLEHRGRLVVTGVDQRRKSVSVTAAPRPKRKSKKGK